MLMFANTRVRLEAEERGRLPVSLEEFESWTGDELLPHPIPGQTWRYDPATGAIF
jgi:hypothetical protein